MSPLSYDEVARHVLVNIPAHQITFRRYDKFSEADEPWTLRSPASLRPCAYVQSAYVRTHSAHLTHLFRYDEARANGDGSGDRERQAYILVFDHGDVQKSARGGVQASRAVLRYQVRLTAREEASHVDLICEAKQQA